VPAVAMRATALPHATSSRRTKEDGSRTLLAGRTDGLSIGREPDALTTVACLAEGSPDSVGTRTRPDLPWERPPTADLAVPVLSLVDFARVCCLLYVFSELASLAFRRATYR
jgi:hypothetical protein